MGNDAPFFRGTKSVLFIGVPLTILMAIYPLVVYYFNGDSFRLYTLFFLLFLSLIRLPFLLRKKNLRGQSFAYVPIVAAVFVLGGYFIGNTSSPYYYPVIVSFLTSGVFLLTILRPPSLVERIARIRNPNLDKAGVVYTKKVTVVWGVFLLINGGVSLWTALAKNEELWAIYNGLISYLLMGVLFCGEFLYRHYFILRKKKG